MYKLLHKNKDFILVNKNQGVDFHHPDPGKGLCAYIRENEGLASLYPVHRLDRMTSGLLLFARNKGTARELSLLFKERKIEKYYLAISDKKPKKTQGLISGDMERTRRGAWKLLRTKKNPAKTCFFSRPYSKGLRLFVLKLLTGKTHQLRVALKSIGAPVLGDYLYYRGESKKHDRGYLHAYALRFNYLDSPYCFIVEPDEGIFFKDESFTKALESFDFKKPWRLKWPKSAG